ncbi:MAG TPA: hypothetical protein VF042_13795 [Gemmatimonadaceae bacterium]
MAEQLTRRRFLSALAVLTAGVGIPVRRVFANTAPDHPAPRAGVTGEKVLTREQLAKTPALIPLFDGIRKIPEIADGIRCNCGCTDPPELRSLLSCFEGKGMARDCIICQSQARLAIRLHKEGKNLDQIRAAIDAKFA